MVNEEIDEAENGKQQSNDSVDLFTTDDSHVAGRETNVAVSWVEKYRPKTLDDMVLNFETKEMLRSMISKMDISNMTLFGSAGIGKSTLARLLARSVDAETLFLNCGVDGTVDVVRNRIQPFCESASSGRIKCVILDEFDAASGGNAAANGMQKALRSLMEAFTDTRFIITCNYPKKIIEPIFSRCPKVHIGFSLRDVGLRLKHIWDTEGIQYDHDTAIEFTKRFVVPNMPDIRLILNTAQMMCSDGVLRIKDDSQSDAKGSALADFADKVLGMVKGGSDYRVVRMTIASNTSVFRGDYEILASALMESVVRNGYSHIAVPLIAEAAYRMSQVENPSLQMTSLVILLKEKL